jgi:Ca2+-binding RTX toxin-like protein
LADARLAAVLEADALARAEDRSGLDYRHLIVQTLSPGTPPEDRELVRRLYADDADGIAMLARPGTVLGSAPEIVPLLGIGRAHDASTGAAHLAAWMSSRQQGSDETVFAWFDRVSDRSGDRGDPPLNLETRLAEQLVSDGMTFLTSEVNAEWMRHVAEVAFVDSQTGEPLPQEEIDVVTTALTQGTKEDWAAGFHTTSLGIKTVGGTAKSINFFATTFGTFSDTFTTPLASGSGLIQAAGGVAKVAKVLGTVGSAASIAAAAVQALNIPQWIEFAERRDALDSLDPKNDFENRYKGFYQETWGQDLGFTAGSAAVASAFAVAGLAISATGIGAPIGIGVAFAGAIIGGLMELGRFFAYQANLNLQREEIGGYDAEAYATYWGELMREEAELALRGEGGEPGLLDRVDDILETLGADGTPQADVVVHTYTQHLAPDHVQFAQDVTEGLTISDGALTWVSTSHRDGLELELRGEDFSHMGGFDLREAHREIEMGKHGYAFEMVDGFRKEYGRIDILDYGQEDGSDSNVHFVPLSVMTASGGITMARHYDPFDQPFRPYFEGWDNDERVKLAEHLRQYYDGWLIYDAPGSGNNTTFDLRNVAAVAKLDWINGGGGAGNEGISFARLEQEIEGYDGNDIVIAGDAQLEFHGGAGFDTVTYQGYENGRPGQPGLRFEIEPARGTASTIHVRKDPGRVVADNVEIRAEDYGFGNWDVVVARNAPTMTDVRSSAFDHAGNIDRVRHVVDEIRETERFIGTDHADTFTVERSFGTQLFGAGGDDLFVIDDYGYGDDREPAAAEGHVRIIGGGAGDDRFEMRSTFAVIGAPTEDEYVAVAKHRLAALGEEVGPSPYEPNLFIIDGGEGFDTLALGPGEIQDMLATWVELQRSRDVLEALAWSQSSDADSAARQVDAMWDHLSELVRGAYGAVDLRGIEAVTFDLAELELHRQPDAFDAADRALIETHFRSGGMLGGDDALSRTWFASDVRTLFADLFPRSALGENAVTLDASSVASGVDLIGTAARDVLIGTARNDRLFGDAGNDRLEGGRGNDVLSGGAGADVIVLGRWSGHDVAIEVDPDAFDGTTVIWADMGYDRVYEATAGTWYWQSGDDLVLDTGSSSLTLVNYFHDVGANGRTLRFEFQDGAYNQDMHAASWWWDSRLAERKAENKAARTEQIASALAEDPISAAAIEAVRPAALDAIASGAASAALLEAATRDALGPVLRGTEADDTLVAPHAGTVVGAGGDDVLDAGTGTTVFVGGTGDDRLRGDADGETYYGGEGRDDVRARAGADTVHGGAGDDALHGHNGADHLFGDAGEDDLYGGADDDRIDGGDGDDRIVAGAGDDLIAGGGGADRFVHGTGDGDDVIADFRYEEGDRLDVVRHGITYREIVFAPEPGGLRAHLGTESILLQGQTIDRLERDAFWGLDDRPREDVLQTGTLSLTHEAATIALSREYENPVALAWVATENGSDPVSVRLDRVSGDLLELRLQEPNHLDGTHVAEEVHWLVVEAGTWVLPDGSLLEAGTLRSDKLSSEGFEQVSFDARFDAAPVILSQVQTAAGSSFVATRQRDADADGFQVTMQEEEALNRGGHATETLGWVALEAGEFSAGGLDWAAGRTSGVTDGPFALRLPDALAPDFGAPDGGMLAQLSSFAGADPAWVRGAGPGPGGQVISVEEDRSVDAETGHAAETVDWFAFSEAGTLDAAPLEAIAETGTLELTHEAVTLTLRRAFDDPVAFAWVATERGSDPVVVRLDEVSGDEVVLRLQEPNYKDGGHKAETVHWMVAETGSWMLPDGTLLEVGTIETDLLSSEGFERVSFEAGFEDTPVILSQVQTGRGPDFVVTRQRDADADGVRLTMQEEEALNGGGHTKEMLGWLAVEAGAGAGADGFEWAAGRAGGVDEGVAAVEAGLDLSGGGVVASLSSYAGPDPAWARGDGPAGAEGFRVSAEEDQSADEETGHVEEIVDWVAFSAPGVLMGHDTGTFV